MIFVDSNVPMYVVGAPHSHKVDAQLLIEQCIAARERMVTDAEVLQEILHRYATIRRLEAIQPAFDALLGVVDEVFPIEESDVHRARDILAEPEPWTARDAIHLAIMERYGIHRIMSFDADFDRRGSISRVFTP